MGSPAIWRRAFTSSGLRQATAARLVGDLEKRISAIPLERFRNFCIVGVLRSLAACLLFSLSHDGVSPCTSHVHDPVAQAICADYFLFEHVAHVDHGKSTLSDRLLELTGTIAPGGNKQILDKLDVERERGITVKAQTCSMVYNYRGNDYLLHLVDTPGHVDFRAEVSRSYASCGGALLLVDASQGVQ